MAAPGPDHAGIDSRSSISGGSVPRVSVCIPLYQKVDYIERTINSVLRQTFKDFELVVLDNGSTDGSGDVVAGYLDARLRVVRSEVTVPQCENFNRAVASSRAPLVVVLCADDLLETEALARKVAILDAEPEVVVVSNRHHVIDDDDHVLARDRTLRTADLLGRQSRSAIVRRVVRHGGNPLGIPANMMFRRAAFDAVGGFGTEAFVLDVSLAVRLTRVGDFYGLPETLAGFRLAAGSVSSSARSRNLRAQRDFIRDVCRDHADVVGRRDVVQGRLRAPLTWLRHHMIMAASDDRRVGAKRVSAMGLGMRLRRDRARGLPASDDQLSM